MATSTFHNAAGRIVRQSFSNCTRYAVSSTLSSYSIDPTTTGLFGSSLRNMAALYQEVRCVGIELQILPNLVLSNSEPASAAHSTVTVFGHTPLRGSTPASFSDVCQLSNCVAITSSQTVKSTFTLRRKDLLNPMPVKWVHFDGSPSTDTDSQGRIWTVASGTDSNAWVVTLLVKSTWEFKSPQPFDLLLAAQRANLSCSSGPCDEKGFSERKKSASSGLASQNEVATSARGTAGSEPCGTRSPADSVYANLLRALVRDGIVPPGIHRKVSDSSDVVVFDDQA